jgi:hypothetical protein
MLLRLFNRLPRRVRFPVWRWLYPVSDGEWCLGREWHELCFCECCGCVAPFVEPGRSARLGVDVLTDGQ